MNTSDIIKSSTLSHAGVKNMAWGVRKYQNPDGSLTPEGRERYNAFRRKDGSTGYYMTEKGQKEFDSNIGNLKKNLETYQKFERTNIQPMLENIASFREQRQLALENEPNHARIDAMSTADIKTEINRIKAVNELRSLTDKQRSSNADKTQKILSVTGNALAVAATAVGIWGSVATILNNQKMREAGALAHAGVKGMKRGYHLFGDYDYKPIGTPAQEEENANRISRERTSEGIKNYRALQRNNRSTDTANTRAFNKQIDTKAAIDAQRQQDKYEIEKQQKLDKYNEEKQRRLDRYNSSVKNKEERRQYSADQDRLNSEADQKKLDYKLSKKTVDDQQKLLKTQAKIEANQKKLDYKLNKKANDDEQKRTIELAKTQSNIETKKLDNEVEQETKLNETNASIEKEQAKEQAKEEERRQKERTKRLVIAGAIAVVGGIAIASYLKNRSSGAMPAAQPAAQPQNANQPAAQPKNETPTMTKNEQRLYNEAEKQTNKDIKTMNKDTKKVEKLEEKTNKQFAKYADEARKGDNASKKKLSKLEAKYTDSVSKETNARNIQEANYSLAKMHNDQNKYNNSDVEKQFTNSTTYSSRHADARNARNASDLETVNFANARLGVPATGKSQPLVQPVSQPQNKTPAQPAVQPSAQSQNDTTVQTTRKQQRQNNRADKKANASVNVLNRAGKNLTLAQQQTDESAERLEKLANGGNRKQIKEAYRQVIRNINAESSADAKAYNQSVNAARIVGEQAKDNPGLATRLTNTLGTPIFNSSTNSTRRVYLDDLRKIANDMLNMNSKKTR